MLAGVFLIFGQKQLQLSKVVNDLLKHYFFICSLSYTLQVALLQEAVRGECQEKEELTAALSQTEEELLGLRPLASHQSSLRSPPNPRERYPPPGIKVNPGYLSLALQTPQTHSDPPLPAQTKTRGRGTDGGRAGRVRSPRIGGHCPD